MVDWRSGDYYFSNLNNENTKNAGQHSHIGVISYCGSM